MEDYQSEYDDSEDERERQRDLDERRVLARAYIDIDAVSLSETPRSLRIRNALENPSLVDASERPATNKKSSFYQRGLERTYGSHQPRKLEQFHAHNSKVDTVIRHSINLDLEARHVRKVERARGKKIEVGPMKGEAAMTEPEKLNPYKIMEKQYQQE